MEELILENLTDTEIKKFAYADADRIAQHVIVRYKDDGFDICSIYYNKFRSAISQEVTCQQLIPLPEKEMEEGDEAGEALPYDYEPEEEAILSELLPRNIGVQIFGALLENAASEQGARMTAMDNATRNAGDMIKNLTLQYNRTRQAAITKELIEIISGAEAL
jgi:F-type H+-transporting ATPase subunit gamma